MKCRFFARATLPQFRQFEPSQFHAPTQFKPDQFKEYQTELTRLMWEVKRQMRSTEIQWSLRVAMANYHPEYVFCPIHPKDPHLATKQYGAVVYFTLHLAKEGLDIINHEIVGDPERPHVLTRQHYEAIMTIPALQHLEQHPAMQAAARRIMENDEDSPHEYYEPYHQYAPTRLTRDW